MQTKIWKLEKGLWASNDSNEQNLPYLKAYAWEFCTITVWGSESKLMNL